MAEKITLQDIARHVGVSKALVSMYLNNKTAGRVAEETKRKIDQAVKDLNYKPSLMAQALSSGKTRTIGMICGGLKNPYFAYLVEDAMEEAAKHGYQLLLALTRWIPQEEEKVLENLLQRQIDGLISCIDTPQDSNTRQILLDSKIPVFRMNEPDSCFSNISTDLSPGLNEAMRRFAEEGYHTVHGSFYANSIWPAAFMEAAKAYKLNAEIISESLNEKEIRQLVNGQSDPQAHGYIVNGYRSLMYLQKSLADIPDSRPSIVIGLDDYFILQNFDCIKGSIYTDTPEIIRSTVQRLIKSIETPAISNRSEIVSQSIFLDRDASAKRQQKLLLYQSAINFPSQAERI